MSGAAPGGPGTLRLRFRSKFTHSQWAAWQSAEAWTAFLGGWGSGKTFLGARAFLRNVLANKPGTDALLVAPFWSTIRKTTLRGFLDATPKQLVTAASKEDRFVEVLGRRVYYGSADNPATLDGANVGAVWVDEGRYLSRDAWRVVLTRLRDKRAANLRGLITSTPGGPWLEEEFATGRERRFAVHASTRENARNLAEGTIESWETTLSARAARVYIDGHFGLLEGAVYSFDKARHLVPWKYRPDLPTVLAWDFGWQRPAALFLQPVPRGTVLPPVRGSTQQRVALENTWIVFDELVPDGISTELLAAQVKAKGYRLQEIYCDPAGDGTQPALGISDVQVLKGAGLPQPKWVTQPRFRHVPTGVRLLDAMLENLHHETRLYVADSLDKPQAKRGVVKDFLAYRYPEAKDGRAISDEPLKDGLTDHTMDALRYWAVNETLRAGVLPEAIRTA